jgi:hypothetical protein
LGLVGDFERDKVRSESEPEINLSKSTSGCVRRSKSRENPSELSHRRVEGRRTRDKPKPN